MKIVTRTVAISNLTAYIGQDLRALAAQHGITSYETGRQNKGWKGLILERLFNSSLRAFEISSRRHLNVQRLHGRHFEAVERHLAQG